MKLKTFHAYINEIQGKGSWKFILNKPMSHDAIVEYHEIYNELQNNMMRDLLAKRKQHFTLINPELISKIYHEHQELGFIKSEKILNNIINQVVKNTAQIRVNNVLSGHESISPYSEYLNYIDDEEVSTTISEDEFDELAYNYVDNNISDYGIKWAEDIVIRLLDAKEDNDKIILLNHLFDIIHQRSDFAEFYVVGGNSALLKISGIDYGVEE